MTSVTMASGRDTRFGRFGFGLAGGIANLELARWGGAMHLEAGVITLALWTGQQPFSLLGSGGKCILARIWNTFSDRDLLIAFVFGICRYLAIARWGTPYSE